MQTTNRYEGRPLLRLVDCLVLDAIDQLDDAKRAKLEALEPTLAQTFNASGTWQEMVGTQMGFADDVQDQIRQFWRSYLDRAEEQQLRADPQEFVIEFVALNFPDLAPPRR
ncbi:MULTISPECIES: hypothetical protein [Variovorax]|jgi:hypothetical protein|uniref:Uncharacterized protein n=1 Tax=Variovorax paradoxus TaxID=34073 RepID=A0AAE3Y0L1_VARPD|nr:MULTISPECIES: hypothetical protein [Variovorax]MBD9664273.1 hypothetical protein [Variovorax sp. VRV01]MDP9965216.1 hypothetical protein [Variovorax paradoxus]MDR6428349.1 hypothetical protein [Variovorax paradoxus]MDR6455002.1 hypothetical protein [Variovorax paradoxus]